MTLPEPDRLDMDDLLLLVINDTAKKYFSHDCDWSNAYRYQKAYMRKNLYMGDMNPENFCERLSKINRMLTNFPFTDDDEHAPPEPAVQCLLGYPLPPSLTKFRQQLHVMDFPPVGTTCNGGVT